MHTATAHLSSIAPYSQSRYHDTPKLEKERADDYERRTWRNRLHVSRTSGNVFIPPMAFKNCLSEAAKFLSMQVPGKGKATFTKHFEAGVLVTEGPDLGVRPEDVEGERLFLNADGKRGSGTRVVRMMPVIHDWSARVAFHIVDETITEDVFNRHLQEAGSLIGIGRFRPRNNGYYGRFQGDRVDWS